VWRRSDETRFPPATLRPDAVLPLLGRLGFDPQATWPRIERGELQLEELAESLAYASDCTDDGSFVRNTFELLLGRKPGKAEEDDLVARLGEGISRPRLIALILRFEEFRKSVTRQRASASSATPRETRLSRGDAESAEEAWDHLHRSNVRNFSGSDAGSSHA
jgi:hypothetical protein